jgi:serine phosphatase RsbU (regulator of sigma subunit)
MRDDRKTKAQLIDELEQLRRQLGEQNRHLTLERAVQQVRAEAASMRESTDLGKLILTLMDGLREAGLRFHAGCINIIDEKAGTFRSYVPRTNESAPRELYGDKLFIEDIQPGMCLLRSAPVPLELALEQGWAQPALEPAFWVAPESFPEALRHLWEIDDPAFDAWVGWHGLNVPFSHGGIWYAAPEGERYDQDDLQLVAQFADAISLGYTRFLDLQAAEERNRQLVIERAAESVRAEAMAMRKADDIANLVAALCRGLKATDLPFDGCIIQLTDEELDVLRLYNALGFDYDFLIESGFPTEIIVQKDLIDGMHLIVADIPLSFAREREYAMPGFKPSIIVQPDSFVDDMRTQFSWSNPHEGLARSYGLNVPFAYGGIYVWGLRGTVYTDPDLQLVEQFAEAVSLGYARYFDIRTAEEAQQKLIAEMEEELQTAHEMQMNLMPTESPQIEGLDIAGRCLTANHVGGDFFHYFPQDGKLSLSLADVTGHAMEAAIPAVMFDGILKTERRFNAPMEQLFTHLNHTLCDTLDNRTFVCFTMAELDLTTRTARLANGGCPYPYHYRAATRDVAELQVEAYPLGVQPDTQFPTIDVQLSPGDRLVFCSDGIIETANTDEELFGFERTAAAIREGCRQSLSAAALLEQIFAEVKKFTGDAPQGDDQTVVVLEVGE